MTVDVKMWSAVFHKSPWCWVLRVIQGSRSLEITTVMPITVGLLLCYSGVCHWIPVTTFNFALPHPPALKFPKVMSDSRLADYFYGEKNSGTGFLILTLSDHIFTRQISKKIWFDLQTSPWQVLCKVWYSCSVSANCTVHALEKVGWVQDLNTSYYTT